MSEEEILKKFPLWIFSGDEDEEYGEDNTYEWYDY